MTRGKKAQIDGVGELSATVKSTEQETADEPQIAYLVTFWTPERGHASQ